MHSNVNISVMVELPFSISKATLYSIVRNRENPVHKEMSDFVASLKRKYQEVDKVIDLWPCKIVTRNTPSHLNLICIIKDGLSIDDDTRTLITQHLTSLANSIITAISTITALELFGDTAVKLSVPEKTTGDAEIKTVNIVQAGDTNIMAYSLFGSMSLNSGLSKEHFIFYDTITGTLFTSTLARVMDAEIHINRNFVMGADTDVQMWCDFLGIPNLDNDQRGWYLQDELYWIDFDNSDPEDIGNGIKAIVIRCEFDPTLEPEE